MPVRVSDAVIDSSGFVERGPRPLIVVGDVWRHQKTSRHYRVLVSQALWEEDLREVVVYQDLHDATKTWVRTRKEFLDGRFYGPLSEAAVLQHIIEDMRTKELDNGE